jgi:hypothetical protein
MARVTGIGGIFLRARDPKALGAWYAKHLDIQLADHGGAILLWTDEVPATTGMTIWSLFPEDTPYFGKGNERGQQQCIVNYRVDDLPEGNLLCSSLLSFSLAFPEGICFAMRIEGATGAPSIAHFAMGGK